jgi:hypothetical protein
MRTVSATKWPRPNWKWNSARADRYSALFIIGTNHVLTSMTSCWLSAHKLGTSDREGFRDVFFRARRSLVMLRIITLLGNVTKLRKVCPQWDKSVSAQGLTSSQLALSRAASLTKSTGPTRLPVARVRFLQCNALSVR